METAVENARDVAPRKEPKGHLLQYEAGTPWRNRTVDPSRSDSKSIMFEHRRTALSFVLAVGLANSARAATINVDWAIPTTPNAISITVGDEVAFTWSGSHSVYQSATQSDYEACATKGGTVVAPTTSSGAWTKTFDAPGDYYYICEVSGHWSQNALPHQSWAQNWALLPEGQDADYTVLGVVVGLD